MSEIRFKIVFSAEDRKYRFIRELVGLGEFKRILPDQTLSISAFFEDALNSPGIDGYCVFLKSGFFPQLEAILENLTVHSHQNEVRRGGNADNEARSVGGKLTSGHPDQSLEECPPITSIPGLDLTCSNGSEIDPVLELDDFVRLPSTSAVVDITISRRPTLLESLSLKAFSQRACILGRAIRELLWDEPKLELPSSPHLQTNFKGPSTYSLEDLDIITVTTDRFKCVLHLARSIRTYLGDRPTITVAVQTRITPLWRVMARRYNVKLLDVPWDCGLSVSRNAAVEATGRPIILLTDDDFQFDERSEIVSALRLFGQDGPSIVGGNLTDVDLWNSPRSEEVSQGFAMRVELSPSSVRWVRLENLQRSRIWLDSRHYLEACDIVDNFALFDRQQIFDKGIKWSPELKIGAEHQDLYLKLLDRPVSIFRTNLLKVRNVKYRNSRFRKMRNRTDFFFSKFFDLHGLATMEIVGERVRGKLQDGSTFHSQSGSNWNIEFFKKVDEE